MFSMDFEEFLWAKGYSLDQIEGYFQHLLKMEPPSDTEYNVMLSNFRGVYRDRRYARNCQQVCYKWQL